MNTRQALSLAILCTALGLGLNASAEQTTQHDHTAPTQTVNADFERIKSLKGTWEGTAIHHGAEPEPATVTYAVTAGGSAVIETEFVGQEHEMVTVYHLIDDQLSMTHYCMLANQPRMAAQTDDDPNMIHFDFAGGTNIDSPDQMHMHSMKLTFVTDDHIRATWTLYNEGAPAGTAELDLKRKTD